MSTFNHELVNHLITNRKYDALQEFGQTMFPERNTNLIVQEYVGSDICVRKHNGDIQIFCPRNMNIVQEGALTRAIENGTIFDDANDVDQVTHHIVATAVPTNALINTGREVPQKLNGVVSMVVGKMDDNGRCCPDETDVENGQNMIKDLVDAKEHNCNARDVVDHYLGNDDHEPVGMDMTKEIMSVEEEVDTMKEVSPEDSITEDDYTELDPTNQQQSEGSDDDEWSFTKRVNSDYEASDIGGQTPIEHYGINDEEDDDNFDDMNVDIDSEEEMTDDNNDESTEELPETEIDTTETDEVEECGDAEYSNEKAYFSEDDDIPTDTNIDTSGMSVDMTANDIDTSSIPDTNMSSVEECGDNGVPIGQNATPAPSRTTVECDTKTAFEEGFLSKRPKKLKPIPREVIAYITVELNNIQDANDQAMLSGYTCSKLELVDFYLNCIDTNDPRYIVPHNKQYLEQMQRELNSLLAQILRIRPINKSDRVWNVNYPY